MRDLLKRKRLCFAIKASEYKRHREREKEREMILVILQDLGNIEER